MNTEQLQKIATDNGLGPIHFQYNIAKNTGQAFEVGYIFRSGERVLFCKRQSYSAPDGFYLCNEFRELEKQHES